ncbi:hypothetical protein COV18_02800 [Candidatus Woesearchaeota archaeon CG10_big_fil_rev_8_21_14_0_10_37_12]|nr:MAG: hypothetical protein COV18_02800 [Candidatus Woesearchaeota archaeon CG10_big_fil_rev_8_21_14_0_10_37_12]
MTELLDVVDEQNNIVGVALEKDIYEQRLNHRIVHVILLNDKGELCLQQLSAHVKYCPGHWTSSATGTVKQGEKYDDAAKRILTEQLGIYAQPIKLTETPYDHYKMRKFMNIYRALDNGPIKFSNKSLVTRWFSIPDIKDMVQKNQLIHPELAHVMDVLYK